MSLRWPQVERRPARRWWSWAVMLPTLSLIGPVPPADAQPPQGPGILSAPAPGNEQPSPESAVPPEPDVLVLRNGGRVAGYVEAADANQVVFAKELGRGKFSTIKFSRSDVAEIVYAPAAGREAMAKRIAWWRGRKSREAAALGEVRVTRVADRSGVWRADGRYVVVFSDTDDVFTRAMAYRLNRVYGLWLDLFGREARTGTPTQIYVLAGQGAFVDLLRQAGMTAQQASMTAGAYFPAIDKGFVPIRSAASQRYERQLRSLEQRYGNRVDQAALEFQKRRLASHVVSEREWAVSSLYHESMHAFMSKELFPGQTELPTWLNEGMASYVMTIREDVDGLGTEAVHPMHYPTVGKHLARGTLPSIQELVGRRTSITRHDTQQSAGAFYAASWGLIYFLNLERGALTNNMYARYVAKINSGANPIAAFEHMTGESLAQTEAAWHRAIPAWH